MQVTYLLTDRRSIELWSECEEEDSFLPLEERYYRHMMTRSHDHTIIITNTIPNSKTMPSILETIAMPLHAVGYTPDDTLDDDDDDHGDSSSSSYPRKIVPVEQRA